MHERKRDLLWQTRIITEVYFFCSLIAYSDADWAGCPDTRWSTSGYWVYLGDNLCPGPQMQGYSLSLQWRSQLSCRGSRCGWMFLALSTSAWASSPLHTATLVFCENASAIYMACNPVQYREKVSLGLIRVLHVPSSHQFPDIMTKSLPSSYSWTFGTFYVSVHLTHWLRGDVKVHTLYSYIIPTYRPNYTRL